MRGRVKSEREGVLLTSFRPPCFTRIRSRLPPSDGSTRPISGPNLPFLLRPLMRQNSSAKRRAVQVAISAARLLS